MSWLGTKTSMQSGGVLCAQTTSLSEIMLTVEYNIMNTFFHSDMLHLSNW